MEHFDKLLLSVWREACRHIEAGESATTIAAVLVPAMPVGSLALRRLDIQHRCLETVAWTSMERQRAALPGRTDLPPEHLSEITSWVSTGKPAHRSDATTRRTFEWLGLSSLRRDALAGPLAGPDRAAGVLILIAPKDEKYTASHGRFFERLLEPFSVVLENDRRIHEIAALREAAEADRRTLLARLGRKDLSPMIVGAQAGLRHVLTRVDTVCHSDVPVLLLGETGAGKEVIARTIHDRSPRHDGPFIRVNCGAIPAELIDSQLFGHERGSFTGATDTHKGWFERADRGTLFLDEIGELPPAAQVRLLRVLQDGYIERVGGKNTIHVDVRIIAATHRDLAGMVREKSFREDLWYRIAVFPIPLPPLRDRSEDIPALACHFAEKAATRFGLPLVMPLPEDIRLLTNYAWPGNIRELAAVIDRAALLGNGRSLEIATALGGGAATGTAFGTQSRSAYAQLEPLPSSPISPFGVPAMAPAAAAPLQDVIRLHIEEALRASHGRIEGPFGAARRLQVNPHTLRARMRKLKIDWRSFRKTDPEA